LAVELRQQKDSGTCRMRSQKLFCAVSIDSVDQNGPSQECLDGQIILEQRAAPDRQIRQRGFAW
jgi:hypothetical protein